MSWRIKTYHCEIYNTCTCIFNNNNNNHKVIFVFLSCSQTSSYKSEKNVNIHLGKQSAPKNTDPNFFSYINNIFKRVHTCDDLIVRHRET